MFPAPLVPGLAVSIFLHECAEKRVIAQPTVFGLAKGIEVRRIAFAFGTPARKPRVCFFQQVKFQRAHAIMFHAAFAQLLQIGLRNNFIETFLREVSGRSRCEVQRCWFQGHRANRIIGAVIASHLIDRQKLDQLESDARRPIDKLPQRFEITDPQIGFRAQGKERREDARDFLLRQ